MSKSGGIIGISDHGGWAILVTVARDGTLLDRRRVELVDDDLPALPHHHPPRGLMLDQAVAMVERVRASAEQHARVALDAVSAAVPSISGVALRSYQPLPPTTAERLEDYSARNVADWVMYRTAIATAAQARGWAVHFYDPKKVFGAACEALRITDFDSHFLQLRKSMGAPWNNDHKLAMAAGIVAASAVEELAPGKR
jgi:hypothetical protein